MYNKVPHIAVIEDGAEDFDLLRYAFNVCGVPLPLVQYAEAGPVIKMFSAADTAAVQMPTLLVLDLNLPDIDGRDALLLLRAAKCAEAVPIIILTTSNNPQDIRLCYARGANGYIVKPVGVVGLKKMARAFKEFWLETVELP